MSPIDYIARAEENMRRELQRGAQESPIDRAVDHYVKVAKTQAVIIGYIKDFAQVMAAAALASQKAVGDSLYIAVNKWVNILTAETKRLIGEQQQPTYPKIESGTVIDQEKSDG